MADITETIATIAEVASTQAPASAPGGLSQADQDSIKAAEAIIGQYSGTPPAPPAPAADPAPSSDPPKADEPVVGADPGDETDTTGKQPADALPKERIGRAMAALHESGVPSTVIERLTRENPDQLVAWGESVESRAPAAPKGEQPASKGDAPASPKFDLAPIAEAFGEDAAKVFGGALEGLSAHYERRIEEIRSQTEQRVEVMSNLIYHQLVDAQRREIEAAYGKVTDTQFAKVSEQAQTLAATGKYGPGDFKKLYTHAAMLELGGPKAPKAAPSAKSVAEREARGEGVPTLGGPGTNAPAKAGERTSNVDPYVMAAEAAIAGGGVESIRAAYNGAAVRA